MKSIPAGKFKTHCLKLMDLARDKNETIVITKRGRPVAKLVPYEEESRPLYGCMAGTVEILDDIVEFNIADEWYKGFEESSYLYE